MGRGHDGHRLLDHSPRSGRPGSRARARATTRSRSATTRASCCAGSTRSTSLGRFFQDEIASPLGLDFYIRLPESIPDSRLATISRPRMRAIFEVPSGGGVGTARAIARAYGVFAAGGRELGLRPATLQALSAPASPPTRGDYDECMLSRGVGFSLGFMQHGPIWPFGSESAFGFPGSGGSLGFADPEAAIGYAYVTSRMGTALTGDPREVALRNALYAALRS